MSNDELRKILDELELKHNHSLYLEIFDRNKDNLNNLAICYRGKKITYKELLTKIVPSYVKTFQKYGINSNSEIPICVSNTPEFIYIVLAASYVGAKINVFGTEFDNDYKTEIINKCNCPFVFVSDDKYEEVKESIANSNIKNIVMTSLTDSLDDGIDPYYDIDKDYYDFRNHVDEYKALNDNIISQKEFISMGVDELVNSPYPGSLDDIFSTTYSSGSTNSTHPKGIVHVNRSYITMGRSHDTDLSNAPSMHGLRVLAMIPTHSNTNLMSNITDTLIQSSCVIPEPIENPNFLLNSFLINKPNFVTATRSLLLIAAKKILYDNQYKKVKLPSLFALFSVGEPTTPGEEKLINKALHKAKAGKLWFDKTEKRFLGKLPISFPVSIAGGDCEHGGIFYTMFKSWFETKEKMIGHIAKEDSIGMNKHQIVSCVILDENGNKVANGKLGRLYATSPCNMLGYRDNPEATSKFFKDIDGTMYGDCSVLATMDDYGRVNIKGRIYKDMPMYINEAVIRISDTIVKDTKNVLSCEIIPKLVNDDYVFVAHIELQPDKRISDKQAIVNIEKRCQSLLGLPVSNKIYYRLHTFDEGYPLTGCGKRNNNKLFNESLNNRCFRPVIFENGVEFTKYNDIDTYEKIDII